MASGASADTIVDLTTANSSGTLGGVIFRTSDFRSAGTGVIDPFVQLTAAGNLQSVQGYNTPETPTGYNNTNNDAHNEHVQLSRVPIVVVNNQRYYEFLLDINQTGSDPLLTLHDVQLWTTMDTTLADAGSLISAFGAPAYAMDTGGNNSVELNYALGSGSGQGDMQMLVPESVLGFDLTKYVVLYSQLGRVSGVGNRTNDGFEEWALGEVTVVPLPPAAWAGIGCLFGAMGLTALRRRGNNRG